MIEYKVQKLAVFFAFLVLSLPSHLMGQQTDSQIRWIDDFNTAVRYSTSNNLPLMLHFYGDNCPPCRLLERKAFQDPALVSKINGNLVAVKINGEKQEELRVRYQVTRWPTDIYLLPTGEELYRTVSPQDPTVYGQIVDRIALRHRDWKAGELAKIDAEERRIANRTSTQIAQSAPVSSFAASGPTTHPVSTSGAMAARVQAMQQSASPQQTLSNPHVNDPSVGLSTARRTQDQQLSAPHPSVPAVSVPAVSAPAIHVPEALGSTAPETKVASSPSNAIQSSGSVPNPESVALDGYCPVSLHNAALRKSTDCWVDGFPQFAVKHRGRIYFCSSEEARKAFLETPDKYAPYFSCFDLIQYIKTRQFIDGKCEYGVFQAGTGRVFLFATQESCDEFRKSEAYYSQMVQLQAEGNERIANQPDSNSVR